jgi:predicted DNA binding CopG/RHH family protein
LYVTAAEKMTLRFGSSQQEKRTNVKQKIIGGKTMRAHYDFAKMQGEKNPYVSRLKQPITIRLDTATVSYFKSLATEIGMPYQNLINLYLRDCALHHKKLALKWTS